MKAKDRIHRNRRTGTFELLNNARKVGPHLVGDGGAAVIEDVIPERRHAIATTPRPRRRVFQQKKHLVYLCVRGYIFYATTTGRPSSGTVKYQKLWPVLKDNLGGDLEGLVDRVLRNTTIAGDKTALDTCFVRGDSFFVLGNRAWWADRFYLYSGILSDGKNFKGTSAVVSGIPKDNNPSGDYNHILSCSVYKNGSAYRMLTCEQRMRLASLGSNYWNYRKIINEYTSTDLENWFFVQTVKENATIDIKDYTHTTPIPGLPVSYLPRKLEHIKNTGSEAASDLGNVLDSLQGDILIQKKGGKLRAWLNYTNRNMTFTSTEGLVWNGEAYGFVSRKDGTLFSSGLAWVVSPPKL